MPRRGVMARSYLASACVAGAWLLLMAAPLSAQTQTTRSKQLPDAIHAPSCHAIAQARVRPSAPTLTYRGTSVRWAEWQVSLGERKIANTIVVVEIDPQRVQLELDVVRDGSALGAWSLDNAPKDAVVAVNAGQFTDAGPWGWVMHAGREWQSPGNGSLAGAITIDSTHRVRIVDASEIPAVRAAGGQREAMQSYPLILRNGRAPQPICTPNAVDATHRDIRLVLGTRADGQVVLLLSRYSGVAGLASQLPIGPTTFEMAEIAWRLGAEQALMLDGGLSAQLLVRDGAGEHRWNGLRRVPLALVGRVARPMVPPEQNP